LIVSLFVWSPVRLLTWLWLIDVGLVRAVVVCFSVFVCSLVWWLVVLHICWCLVGVSV